MGTAQDQWYPVFIFKRSHDIHHSPFGSHAYELTRNHHGKLFKYVAKAWEVTPLNVLVAYVTGRSGMLFSMSDSLHTFQCQRSVLPVMLLQQGFQISTCLMAGMYSVSIQNRPKSHPYLPLYGNPDISGFGASIVKKHQCLPFFPPSRW